MQDRAVATRQKLIQAAAKVFASRGYAGASMSDILSGAGVTKGALYFHFSSKEDLALAIFAEDSRFSATPASTSARPLQDLIDMSHEFATSLQRDPVAQASVRLATELTFADATTPPGYATWSKSVAQLLNEARLRGDLATEVPVDDAAEAIIASFTGLQLVSEAVSRRADLHERVTKWWRLVLVGLASPAILPLLEPRGSRQIDDAREADALD